MTAEIPGIRPKVVEASLAGDLSRLLSFRHFVRHAYAVSFDTAQLSDLEKLLLTSAAPIDAALDAFEEFLRASLESLSHA